MGKTLHELACDLKAYIINLQSDVRDKQIFRPERYNNLKLEMNVARDITAQVRISMGMSEARYDLKTGEKVYGSLGIDEKYIQRWLAKGENMLHLMECWNARVKNRGKITDVE